MATVDDDAARHVEPEADDLELGSVLVAYVVRHRRRDRRVVVNRQDRRLGRRDG
jgi:hypothetical protein